MQRNIQIKIIILFLLIGIVIIGVIGVNAIYSINRIASENNINLNNEVQNLRFIFLISTFVYLIMCTLIGTFVSKALIKPMNKLIKSAEKLATEENIDIKRINKMENKTEVDELADVFSVMTTELKQNLEEVNRQKNQIETILLHMTDGIIVFDINGNVMHINPAAKEMLNIFDKTNTFKSIFEKINVDINMEKIIYLEDWTTSEQRVNIGDRYLNIYFEPYKDVKDKPEGLMVLVQDITEHVKLDNMRKEFVADVSHELKTPITSIMGYSDTLLEGEYDKETQERFLNVISSEARRMAKLVTDLLILSRYDNNKITNKFTEFDLGELVKKCQEKLQIEIDKKSHQVECFVTANVPPVIANRDGIERVVLNIMTNSIKYTPKGGVIKIYVGFVYNDAYIKIIDNGIGIPEDDLNRIFERFYRVDKARSRELGGTGLGLSIAKEILDQNNGSIDIKSKQGKGTEVVIRIPTKR